MPTALRATLDGWSTDLLLTVALQIEQEIGACTPLPPKLKGVAGELQRAYLRRLGFAEKRLTDEETRAGFRLFLVPKDDIEVLAKAVKALPPSAPRLAAKTVYRRVAWLRGVPVLGGDAAMERALAALVGDVCGKRSPCPFWDPLTIYRVVLTREAGLAAYVPETAALVLSEALLGAPNRLHRLVVLHELAHVAERAAWLRDRRVWKNEFAVFSGWSEGKETFDAPHETLAPSREDELAKLSADDAFSLLPDPVLGGGKHGETSTDGFVLAKSYRETASRRDVSEDLADHVAAFHAAPERYCHGTTALAPRKWSWVRTAVFAGKPPGKGEPKLPCDPAGGKRVTSSEAP